jgi:NADH-quinone oxidoreductase subunit N
LTAGFLGKFYVLAAGASAAAWTLIMVLIVSSTIGLVYYLRIIVAMFAEQESAATASDAPRVGLTSAIALGVLTIALFVLGVYPAPLWNAIAAATTALSQRG